MQGPILVLCLPFPRKVGEPCDELINCGAEIFVQPHYCGYHVLAEPTARRRKIAVRARFFEEQTLRAYARQMQSCSHAAFVSAASG